jgi:hypothetical protein
MSHLRHTILAISIAAVSLGVWAQTDSQPAQHHANAAALKADNAEKMAAMDSKMKLMHEAHKAMVSAKTPEEKNALMASHMKAMQDGMQTMDMMGPDGMGPMKGEKHFPRSSKERLEMMQKRMEMMESMMQMMMDRMPATP